MPIYEYKCTKCEEIFDIFQKVGEGNEKLKCPKCGAEKPERVFSPFSSCCGDEKSSTSTCSPSPTRRFS